MCEWTFTTLSITPRDLKGAFCDLNIRKTPGGWKRWCSGSQSSRWCRVRPFVSWYDLAYLGPDGTFHIRFFSRDVGPCLGIKLAGLVLAIISGNHVCFKSGENVLLSSAYEPINCLFGCFSVILCLSLLYYHIDNDLWLRLGFLERFKVWMIVYSISLLLLFLRDLALKALEQLYSQGPVLPCTRSKQDGSRSGLGRVKVIRINHMFCFSSQIWHSP